MCVCPDPFLLPLFFSFIADGMYSLSSLPSPSRSVGPTLFWAGRKHSSWSRTGSHAGAGLWLRTYLDQATVRGRLNGPNHLFYGPCEGCNPSPTNFIPCNVLRNGFKPTSITHVDGKSEKIHGSPIASHRRER